MSTWNLHQQLLKVFVVCLLLHSTVYICAVGKNDIESTVSHSGSGSDDTSFYSGSGSGSGSGNEDKFTDESTTKSKSDGNNNEGLACTNGRILCVF